MLTLVVIISVFFVVTTVSAVTTISTNISTAGNIETTAGTLTVAGATTLTGAATLSSTLNVTGLSTLTTAKVGSSGTTLSQILKGTCSLVADVSIAATSTGTGTCVTTGSVAGDVVFISLATTTTKLAAQYSVISPGGQQAVQLVLLSDKKANAGLVRIPVTISYLAIDGISHTQTTGIDLMMKGKAELGFVSVDFNPPRLTENTPFDLTIRIENTGTGDAKQVSAKIDLPAEGTKEAFIGKIKPGNDAPAIFLLEGTTTGNHPYNLTITYTDDMGVHTMTRQMNMRVPAADISGKIIIGLIILVILGAVGYRYWYLPRKNGNGKLPWVKKN